MYFSNDEPTKCHLLPNLGKSTMRGIKKCPKCGTYNGTRGLSCKNKSCDVVFKEAGEKKKQSVEVSKLHTGNSTRIYSVRVRDKGPDHRGFVQLPVLQNDLTNASQEYLSQVSALCFVDTCQRLFSTNILKCHERQISTADSLCSHILSAMNCCADSTPLRIDYSILQSLQLAASVKEEIWQIANEIPGPLVQRVSKNVMAVRCKLTTKHPLGFLHISFYTLSRLKENNSVCPCASTVSSPKKPEKKTNLCIHYYACVAAFASDPKCSEEFANFIFTESGNTETLVAVQNAIEELDGSKPLVAILSHDNASDSEKVEVLNKDLMLTDIVQEFETLAPEVVQLNEDSLQNQSLDLIVPNPPKKIKIKKPIKNLPKHRKILAKNASAGRKLLGKDLNSQLGISNDTPDETKAHITFIEWLSSVTERINQAMHFGFSGKPEPLVFHVPHAFFNCLRERFPSTSVANQKRKRLPNFVATFTRKDAPPVGSFNNFTWLVTNIVHAKTIFDTPLIKLNVSKTFALKSDGNYEELELDEQEIKAPRKKGQPLLKPAEYKTFLKIGNTSSGQPSVLAIDWTPNVLPVSQIGELKITFEYGQVQSTHEGIKLVDT